MPTEITQRAVQTAALTAVAMIAFAANSLLCRLALGGEMIDAGRFAAIRVVAGAVTLGLILLLSRARAPGATTGWRGGAMLFTYLVFFSFAYVWLSAGTGALILFGAVQLTMFATALWGGERFAPLSWAGLALAVIGLIYLVSPGVTAPDPLGAALMAIAGVAWGFYSLLGRGVSDPLASTAYAFFYAALPTIAVAAVSNIPLGGHFTTQGVTLAVASGAIASGLGYVIWFAALRGLTATRAATVQLSVPAIAAFGGVAIGEELTTRLILASAATLGGIAIVLTQRTKPKAR